MTSNSTFDKQTQYRGHRGKTGLDIKYILFISTSAAKLTLGAPRKYENVSYLAFKVHFLRLES